MEGFILDKDYLSTLQKTMGTSTQGFCSYAVGTENLSNPEINWCGDDTYIQKTRINNNFGVFATPDEFYEIHHQDFPFWKRWLHENVIRHWMNARVKKIRKGTLLPKKFMSPLNENNWKKVVKAS